ncbi:MAG: elongation factor Ts [Clostridia bacterium]|nr:elongation factor Ts [Clostridia bacterium]
MAAITAKMVADLRAQTGCGMMECKKALTASNGDFDEAVKVLREKGLAVAAKKATRIASEGVVDIMLSEDGKTAAMIEVNAETDFVAKNEKFQEFVRGLLTTIIAHRPADVEALKTLPYPNSDFNVEGKLKDMIFTIGENMNIRRFLIVDGVLSTYIHGKGTTGVIINFEADDVCAANPGFAEFAKNIALQVAAMPVLYLNKESVPAADLEAEKQIQLTLMKNDPKNANKPENILEKMIMGKMNKFYEKNCLTEQSYIKDDNMSVSQYVAACAKEFGGNIAIKGFSIYERGEGLEKKEDNFAEEIASMMKK